MSSKNGTGAMPSKLKNYLDTLDPKDIYRVAYDAGAKKWGAVVSLWKIDEEALRLSGLSLLRHAYDLKGAIYVSDE